MRRFSSAVFSSPHRRPLERHLRRCLSLLLLSFVVACVVGTDNEDDYYDYLIALHRTPAPQDNTNNNNSGSARGRNSLRRPRPVVSNADKDAVFKGTRPLAEGEILTFLHIPHTAGTLVSLALKEAFVGKVCTGSRISGNFFATQTNSTVFRQRLDAWQCTNESFYDPCAVAFFHEDYSFVEEFYRTQSAFCSLRPMTFLRDPLKLRLSYFPRESVVSHPGKDRLPLTAENVEAWVTKWFEPNSTVVKSEVPTRLRRDYGLNLVQLHTLLGTQNTNHFGIGNVMTHRGSNQGPNSTLDLAVATAISQIDHSFWFVGITEQLDLSLCLLSVRLGMTFRWRQFLLREPLEVRYPSFAFTNRTIELLDEALKPELVLYEYVQRKLLAERRKLVATMEVNPQIREYVQADRWCQRAGLVSSA